jgi:hypothetical protein
MTTSLPAIIERRRISAPGALPMALGYENGNLWSGSAKDWTIRGLRIADGSILHEAKAPAKPFGGLLVGDMFRIICGDADDNRSIRYYRLGAGFSSATIRCPNNSGNFLAHDGTTLYVSQRFDRLFVQVDYKGNAVQQTPMPRAVVGVVFVDGAFFILTTDGSERDDDIRFAKMFLNDGAATITEIAHVPFGARSLAFDGSAFWTSWRAQDLIVSFVPPT